MFELTTLRRSESNSTITFGQIAQALLFYQKVHIFIDRGTLFSLIEQIGTGNLLILLDRPEVTAVYCEEMVFTASDSAGISPYYSYAIMVLAGDKKDYKLKPLRERLEWELNLKGYPAQESKQFSRLFLKKVEKQKLSNEFYIPGGIINATTTDLSDNNYVDKIIRYIIEVTPGGYKAGDNLRFRVNKTPQGMLYVDTNINFELINQNRSQMIPPVEPLTIPHLLSHIIDARVDLALAAYYGSDFITSTVNSTIIQIRHSELLRRANINADLRKEFTEIHLPDAPSVAEVLDSKHRSFEEFIILLDEAKNHKAWLKNVPPEENLVRDYANQISSISWIDSAPSKVLRYVLIAKFSLAFPLEGAAIGLASEFLISKLSKGWCPSHFVTTKLHPFVQNP